jgi:dTDP-4-amino-4,6-dideoxygalactose transaminase
VDGSAERGGTPAAHITDEGSLAAEAAAALRVPIVKPSLGVEEAELVRESIESGWIVQGPRVAEFERAFADYTGSQYGAATTSCTTALHLAVAILGLKPGDEVIVPAFTWVSTANVVEYMGGTPRFCDVDLETFNIDVSRVEGLIGERTVGIIPVHLFGLCAEMGPVMELAERHGLWVLEDAACALGAWQDGRHAGTIGDLGAFSLHPRKSITTGEGGMLTTQRADWDEEARSLRDHGCDLTDLRRHEEPQAFLLSDFHRLGYNYRMTDLQGALGCAQMKRVDWVLDERRRRAALYDEALRDNDWLATPAVPEGNTHGYQAYVCLFRPEEPSLDNLDRLEERRNAVMTQMERRGIATRQGTHAAALTAYYAERYGIDRGDVPVSAIAERLSLALPLYPDMTDEEQELVLTELRSAFEAS